MENNNIKRIIKEIRAILINEAKNTSIIVDKIGLPTEIADWITNDFNEKFQLWFANNFKKEAVKRISGDKPVIAMTIDKLIKGDATQISLKNQLLRQKSYFDGMFRHVSQWLSGRREIAPENDEINLREMSLEEAVRRADVWHEAVQRLKIGAIVDESGKIIKAYPDGYYWINLQKSNCDKEARAMGHCGSGSGILYSLRKNKHPYLTGDVHRNNLIQLRGRANTKPKVEYHNFIMDFLLDPAVQINSMNPSSYRPEQNFELKDLSLENLIRLYQSKPRLFVPEELYKVLLKYPEFAHEVNFKTTPVEQDHKENLIRKHPGMQELMGR